MALLERPVIIFCVDPDVACAGVGELEKSPSPFTSKLSEYSISKVTLVLVSIHETVIESDVMVLGVFSVGGERDAIPVESVIPVDGVATAAPAPPVDTPSVVAFSIFDHALLLLESVEEIARI